MKNKIKNLPLIKRLRVSLHEDTLNLKIQTTHIHKYTGEITRHPYITSLIDYLYSEMSFIDFITDLFSWRKEVH